MEDKVTGFRVAQWKRIHLPMQETWVRSLIQDPTCCAATKPVRPNSELVL